MRFHVPTKSRFVACGLLLWALNSGCGQSPTDPELDTMPDHAEADSQMSSEATEIPTPDDEGDGDEDSLGNYSSVSACSPTLSVYPVRGKHNNGYDRTAGDSSQWTCDSAHSNSDFVRGDHLGNDIWAREGTPVAATVDGVLTLTGFSSYSGNKVTIKDRCGWYHFNAHLQKLAPNIANGKRVKAGQIIGYVGKTGTASNGVVHLHYSVYPSGSYNRGIDPYPLLKKVESKTCSTTASPTPTPPTPTPPATTPNANCSVHADHRLYCKNGADVAIRAKPENDSTIVNRMRTTKSWFTCWAYGDRHASGNTTWYYTVGDDNKNWGWVAAAYLYTSSAFDANPAAHGLRACK